MDFLVPIFGAIALLIGAMAWIYVWFRRSASQAKKVATEIRNHASAPDEKLREIEKRLSALQDQASDIDQRQTDLKASQSALEVGNKNLLIEISALKSEFEDTRAGRDAINEKLVSAIEMLAQRTFASLETQSAELQRLHDDFTLFRDKSDMLDAARVNPNEGEPSEVGGKVGPSSSDQEETSPTTTAQIASSSTAMLPELHEDRLIEKNPASSLPEADQAPQLPSFPGSNERSEAEVPDDTTSGGKSWLEDICEAFHRLNGRATYDELYPVLADIRPDRLTREWKATVRRTIEDHSSDSENFRGKDVFLKLGRGIWALRDLDRTFEQSDADLDGVQQSLGNAGAGIEEVVAGEMEVPANNENQERENGPSRRIAPDRRGGRPREYEPTEKAAGDEDALLKCSSSPRPTLMVRREEGVWMVYATLDRDGNYTTANSVMAAGLDYVDYELKPNNNGLYGPLTRPATKLIAIRNESEITTRALCMGGEKPLMFQLSGSGGEGWLVSNPSSGFLFAIAPNAWERDEEIGGKPVVMPESTSLDGWRAHYFDIDTGQGVAFQDNGGLSKVVTVQANSFRLEGDIILDENSRSGPLVGRRPPRVIALPGAPSIRTVVFGEEGPGPDRWRTSEVIDSDAGLTIVPETLLHDRESGWFFIRLYDGDDELVQSMPFRYVGGLISLTFHVPPRPGQHGHEPSLIKVRHGPSVQITVVSPEHENELQKSRSVGETTIVVDASPDIAACRLSFKGRNGSAVLADIPLERIWWRLVSDASEETMEEWRDTVIAAFPEDFDALSDSQLQVQLPRMISNASKPHAGFSERGRRPPEKWRPAEGRGLWSLNMFFDAQELRQVGKHIVHLWPNDNDLAISVVAVSRSKQCQWCGEVIGDALEMVDHVLSRHAEECFEHLQLTEEMGTKGIPSTIYVCMNCGAYWPDSGLRDENPIAFVMQHLDRVHDRARLNITGGKGAEKLRGYCAISNAVEIRAVLAAHKKVVWRCKLGDCEPIIPTKGDPECIKAKEEHIRNFHAEPLCRIDW